MSSAHHPTPPPQSSPHPYPMWENQCCQFFWWKDGLSSRAPDSTAWRKRPLDSASLPAPVPAALLRQDERPLRWCCPAERTSQGSREDSAFEWEMSQPFLALSSQMPGPEVCGAAEPQPPCVFIPICRSPRSPRRWPFLTPRLTWAARSPISRQRTNHWSFSRYSTTSPERLRRRQGESAAPWLLCFPPKVHGTLLHARPSEPRI